MTQEATLYYQIAERADEQEAQGTYIPNRVVSAEKLPFIITPGLSMSAGAQDELRHLLNVLLLEQAQARLMIAEVFGYPAVDVLPFPELISAFVDDYRVLSAEEKRLRGAA